MIAIFRNKENKIKVGDILSDISHRGIQSKTLKYEYKHPFLVIDILKNQKIIALQLTSNKKYIEAIKPNFKYDFGDDFPEKLRRKNTIINLEAIYQINYEDNPKIIVNIKKQVINKIIKHLKNLNWEYNKSSILEDEKLIKKNLKRRQKLNLI